jgi:hypothetical protein
MSIEAARNALGAVRIGERVLNRRTHVGRGELGDDRPVDELDHRMDDGFGVDHDLDFFGRQIE